MYPLLGKQPEQDYYHCPASSPLFLSSGLWYSSFGPGHPRASSKGIPCTDTLVEIIIFSKPAPYTHTDSDSDSERFKQELLNPTDHNVGKFRQMILGTIKPGCLKNLLFGSFSDENHIGHPWGHVIC